MVEEVVKGVVNRPRRLLGLGQAVEVIQDVGVVRVQIEVELAAGAELKQIQSNPPPGQKAAVVLDGLLVACIGQAVQPGVEVREEVADGLRQAGAECYQRPCFRLRCGTWL